jgi:YidC/Oxa1 family membrane protein insertase
METFSAPAQESGAGMFRLATAKAASAAPESAAADLSAAAASGADNVVNDASALATADAAALAAEASSSLWPPAIAQTILETIHLSTGLPWWASIAAMAATMRLVLFPVAVKMQQAVGKQQILKPEIELMTNKIKGAVNTKERQVYTKELTDFMARHNINPIKTVGLGFIQMPFFMTFFFSLRSLGERFPEVSEGGALWFADLAAMDPTYALPVISAGTMLFMLEHNANIQANTTIAGMYMRNFLRFLSIAVIPFTANMPCALFMYWIPSNLCTLTQNAVLSYPAVKKYFNIPAAPPQIMEAKAGEAIKAVAALQAVKPATVYTRRPTKVVSASTAASAEKSSQEASKK